MRTLLNVAVTAFLIFAASFALAQDASVQIAQPWARATPAGASTGAIYLTITNKSHDADRLLSASSDVADKQTTNSRDQGRQRHHGNARSYGRLVCRC
jgi:copper(I)-binding protein